MMTRGEVASLTGVNLETLRYYETRGLVRPQRSKGGWRRYPPDAVRRIRFILRAGELGFTLDEVRDIFSLRPSMTRKSQIKIAEVTAKIRDLRRLKRALDDGSPVVAALSGE